MRCRIGCWILAGTVALVLSACSNSYETAERDGWRHFGGQPDQVGPEVALGAIGGDEQNIVVHGTVIAMCKTSGCWVKVRDDKGDELFISSEKHGYYLPTNAMGHRVVAHGEAVTETTSVEERRHFAQVSGASAEEIAAITEPLKRVIFLADSIYIEGADLTDAYTPKQAAEACAADSGGKDHK